MLFITISSIPINICVFSLFACLFILEGVFLTGGEEQVWNCPGMSAQPPLTQGEAVAVVEAGTKNQDPSRDAGSHSAARNVPYRNLAAPLFLGLPLAKGPCFPGFCFPRDGTPPVFAGAETTASGSFPLLHAVLGPIPL